LKSGLEVSVHIMWNVNKRKAPAVRLIHIGAFERVIL
jgi:hypothetical protein